jgi:Protein of unknown function (DUF2934)
MPTKIAINGLDRKETPTQKNALPLTKEIKIAEKKEATQQSAIEEKPQPTEDEIRERAYEIYCARNGAPGSEEDDWLKAEAELKEKHATSG